MELRVGQLISEIQSGALTMEAYVRLVKGKIDDERELLRQLETLKLDADAQKCKKRIQLMEGEVGGA